MPVFTWVLLVVCGVAYLVGLWLGYRAGIRRAIRVATDIGLECPSSEHPERIVSKIIWKLLR